MEVAGPGSKVRKKGLAGAGHILHHFGLPHVVIVTVHLVCLGDEEGAAAAEGCGDEAKPSVGRHSGQLASPSPSQCKHLLLQLQELVKMQEKWSAKPS